MEVIVDTRNNSLDSFDVFFTKCRLKHLLATATHQKCPITLTIMLEIWCHLDTNLVFHFVILALFCTAFFSFLWKSNFTVAPTTSFDLRHLVTHQGIEFTESRAFCHICWKKTLQHKEGASSFCSTALQPPFVHPPTLPYASPHFIISTVVLSWWIEGPSGLVCR